MAGQTEYLVVFVGPGGKKLNSQWTAAENLMVRAPELRQAYDDAHPEDGERLRPPARRRGRPPRVPPAVPEDGQLEETGADDARDQPEEDPAPPVPEGTVAMDRMTVRPAGGRRVRGEWHYEIHAPGRGRSGQVGHQLVPAKLYPLELQQEYARDGMGPPELLAEETAGTVAEGGPVATTETGGRPGRGAAERARTAITRQLAEGEEDGRRPASDPPAEHGRYLPAGAARSCQLFEATWADLRSPVAVEALAEWCSKEHLAGMSLPVTVTYRVREGQWRPWTLAAESAVLQQFGLPTGHGLWVLERMGDGDRLPDYEGKPHGAYPSERLAARAAVKSKSRHVITSKRQDGRWAVVDGAHARAGGVQMLNDIRGTGRTADVSIYADRSVAVCAGKRLTPASAVHTFEQRAASEVLTDYGQRYWKAYAPVDAGAPPEDLLASVYVAATVGADWW